jgi:hypothetical protein
MLRTPSAFGTSSKSEMESLDANLSSTIGFGGGWVGVLSSGAACRMQIRQGTGIEAIHPIVLIAQLLKEASRVEE